MHGLLRQRGRTVCGRLPGSPDRAGARIVTTIRRHALPPQTGGQRRGQRSSTIAAMPRSVTRDESRRDATHASGLRAHLSGLVAHRPDVAHGRHRRRQDRPGADQRRDLAVHDRRRRLRGARRRLHRLRGERRREVDEALARGEFVRPDDRVIALMTVLGALLGLLVLVIVVARAEPTPCGILRGDVRGEPRGRALGRGARSAVAAFAGRATAVAVLRAPAAGIAPAPACHQALHRAHLRRSEPRGRRVLAADLRAGHRHPLLAESSRAFSVCPRATTATTAFSPGGATCGRGWRRCARGPKASSTWAIAWPSAWASSLGAERAARSLGQTVGIIAHMTARGRVPRLEWYLTWEETLQALGDRSPT